MTTQSAVALRYPEGEEAPFITLKLHGDLAQRLVELAEEKQIPVFKNAGLLDVLTLYEVGDYIPEETYEVMAGIFAFIKRMAKDGGISGK